MQFVLQWRPWGNSLPVVQRWIEDRGLSNVSVETDRVDNMAAVYQKAHATVFCVVDPRMCKPVPNSIAESMACGRPVVVTNRTGLAELVIEHRAGFVIEPDAEALAVSLDELADNLQSYGTRARSAAESAFDQSEFVRAYRQIYNEMV